MRAGGQVDDVNGTRLRRSAGVERHRQAFRDLLGCQPVWSGSCALPDREGDVQVPGDSFHVAEPYSYSTGVAGMGERALWNEGGLQGLWGDHRGVPHHRLDGPQEQLQDQFDAARRVWRERDSLAG
jgi:hypothetical protein